jgi:zinc/manganese transport system permease protein
MALATALGLLAGYVGLLLSYFLNLPSGPAIVLAGGGFYFLSLSATRYAPRRNVLIRENA